MRYCIACYTSINIFSFTDLCDLCDDTKDQSFFNLINHIIDYIYLKGSNLF